MKIDYISDIHINHWATWHTNQEKFKRKTIDIFNKLIENGNGEILIIGGDFSEWNVQSKWVLETASKQYERVYWTYGNHDMYLLSKNQQSKYGDSKGRLNELVEITSHLDNVIPLIKTTDTYKGVTFAGDMLWYLPKTQQDWSFFKQVSNDSKYISLGGYSKEDMVRNLWKESQDWYETLEDKHIDVMVTHVPPVHNPYSIYGVNNLYITHVPFIAAKHWVVGHDHLQANYTKIDTQFYANCIGYAQDYDNYKTNTVPEGKIDTYKNFGIKTFTI